MRSISSTLTSLETGDGAAEAPVDFGRPELQQGLGLPEPVGGSGSYG